MTNLRVIDNKYDHDNYAALAIMNGRIDLQKEPFIIGDNWRVILDVGSEP